jgi:hypothetical protein
LEEAIAGFLVKAGAGYRAAPWKSLEGPSRGSALRTRRERVLRTRHERVLRTRRESVLRTSRERVFRTMGNGCIPPGF